MSTLTHLEKLQEQARERFRQNTKKARERFKRTAGKSRGTKRPLKTQTNRPHNHPSPPPHALIYRTKGISKTLSFENVINLSEDDILEQFKLPGRKELTQREYGDGFLEQLRKIKTEFIESIKQWGKEQPSEYEYNYSKTKINKSTPIPGTDLVKLEIDISQTKPSKETIKVYLEVPKETTDVVFNIHYKDVPHYGGKLQTYGGKLQNKIKNKKNKKNKSK